MDFTSVCIVCLANRENTDLLPLGEFEELYEILAGKNELTGKKLFICLTCCDVFNKILEFQKKIQSALVVLALNNDLKNNTIPEIKHEPVTENGFDDNFYNDDEPLEEISELNEFIKSENDENSNSLNSNRPNNVNCVESERKVVKPCRSRGKKVWSDKDIDNFIIKHHLPYNRKYVRQLIDDRNMEYKVVIGKKLYKTRFDLVVETQVCVDDKEVMEVMQQSRNQHRFNTKINKCEKCVLAFKGRISLREHIKKNHAKARGRYECEFCGTRSSTKESLATHIRSHYNKYICKVCQHVECNEQRISEHMRYKNKLYQCPKCEQTFGVVGQFYEHYKAIHQSFTCDYCQRSYKDRLWFEKHIIDNHLTHRCTQCPKVYPNYTKLFKHVQAAHVIEGQSERTYCVECNRYFKSRMRYRQHLYQRHRQLKRTRHPCPECGLSFFCNAYLNRHINHVHRNRSAKCDKCSKSFVDKAHLHMHVLSVHDKVRPPKNKMCQYCDRGFSSTRILTHHIRTHTGEKPHQCPLCDAAFAQKTAMLTHVKARHKDAPEQTSKRPNSPESGPVKHTQHKDAPNKRAVAPTRLNPAP